MAVQINQGTQTQIYTKTNAGTEVQVIKLDIGSGTTLQDFGGTVLAVNNVANGTINRINGGTVDTIGFIHPDKFATVVSSGTSTLGTIKAAVAGSAIFVTDITISAGSASNVVVASGGTSTPILGTLFFNANGGMVGNFRTPLSTAVGSALVFQQSANGPLTFTVEGYVD